MFRLALLALLTLFGASGSVVGSFGCGGGSAPTSTSSTAILPIDLVSAQAIADGATDVALNAPVTFTSKVALDAATVTAATFTVVPLNATDGTATACTAVTYDSATNTVTCTHGNLAPGIAYTITVTTDLKTAGGSALAAALATTFTTSSTASSESPTAKLVVPSMPISGDPGDFVVVLAFDQAMQSESITTGAIQIATATAPTTNLCTAVDYDTTTNRATCTMQGTVPCSGDSVDKYVVTVNSDARNLESQHAVTPLSSYFTNIDNGFDNSETLGAEACIVHQAGSQNGVNATAEVVSFDTASSVGRLLFAGDAGGVGTAGSRFPTFLAMPQVSPGGAFGMTVKIESLSGASAETKFSVGWSPASDVTSSIGFRMLTSPASYVLVSAVDSVQTEGSSAVSTGSGILSTSPLYVCITRSADGTSLGFFYDEGGSGSFTQLTDAGLTFPTITDPLDIGLSMVYDDPAFGFAIDYMRFNVGEASCPPISGVE
jgi:hypothetical protein